MNSPSNALPNSASNAQPVAPAALSPTRPVYWSIRREFWENRYLYIAPLAAAAVFFLGFLISVIHSPGHIRAMLTMDVHHANEDISGPFDLAAALMMGTSILVSVFYCIDALYSERRDRSILFWKSLPVSDRTTVLAKASIPLLIVPLLVSAITAALQWLMLLLSAAALLSTGGSAAPLWTHEPVFKMSLLMLYHVLTAHALWPAPVYCWLILVSGWARRAAFLWASLPILAIGGLERLAFNTGHFFSLVAHRFFGATAPIASTAPDIFPTNPMTHITPAEFLAAPGLWTGLAVAAIFLLAAIRLRRHQGPI